MEPSDFSSQSAQRRELPNPVMDERWRPGATVGVIGGLGEMGSLFARLFENLGYSVLIADPSGAQTNEEVVRDSDVVLFAVPLHLTVPIIRSVVPHVREDQLLMDLTSLKQKPIAEMLRSPASVVGLHPMFGGKVSSFEGQTLIACPARVDDPEWVALRSMFESVGMVVKESDPEEHDRIMSIVQVLFHVNTMLIGRVLRKLDVDIDETLEYTSPSYLLEMDLLGRIFAQNSSLYAAITQMNPHTGEVFKQMREGLEEYESWYERSDLRSFVNDFEESAAHLGDFCERAYRESSEILRHVVHVRRAPGILARRAPYKTKTPNRDCGG